MSRPTFQQILVELMGIINKDQRIGYEDFGKAFSLCFGGHVPYDFMEAMEPLVLQAFDDGSFSRSGSSCNDNFVLAQMQYFILYKVMKSPEGKKIVG